MGDFYLWTPVANALEVYRRRVLNEPDAVYEHIWRLIHVHEALVVTLGAALASRLLHRWQKSVNIEENAKLNELRSRITGIHSEGTVQNEACLSGSIEAWVQLLERFGKPDMSGTCPFCEGLGGYLCEGLDGQIRFLDTWKRVAPIPAGAEREKLSRVERFRAVNQLRNKIAHVPLPTRVLGELHKGLRNEILGALSPKYDASKDSPSQDFPEVVMHKPLRGRVLSRGFVCTGSVVRGKKTDSDRGDEDVLLQSELTGEQDSWVACPFFGMDEECKVSLLFRIRSDMDADSDFFSAEYHRFAAEFEPVSGRDIERDILGPWLEISATEGTKSLVAIGGAQEANGTKDTIDGEELGTPLAESQDPDILRSIAEEAYFSRDYEKAACAFERLARTADKYKHNHVAKLHYGKSLWRTGYANTEAPQEQRIQAIQKAVEVLREASDHVDARYSAQARYEMSKAYHKLWKLTGDGYLDEAYKAADDAAKLDYQMAYITWIEHLDDEKRRSE